MMDNAAHLILCFGASHSLTPFFFKTIPTGLQSKFSITIFSQYLSSHTNCFKLAISHTVTRWSFHPRGQSQLHRHPPVGRCLDASSMLPTQHRKHQHPRKNQTRCSQTPKNQRLVADKTGRCFFLWKLERSLGWHVANKRTYQGKVILNSTVVSWTCYLTLMWHYLDHVLNLAKALKHSRLVDSGAHRQVVLAHTHILLGCNMATQKRHRQRFPFQKDSPNLRHEKDKGNHQAWNT